MNDWKIIPKESMKESMIYVNATPDEDYPIRILRAHLESEEG